MGAELKARRTAGAGLAAFILAWSAAFTASACLPGGIIDRGGPVDRLSIAPVATLTRGAPYKIVCVDQAELQRRESLAEDELRGLAPAVRYEDPREYHGDCSLYGETSVFFLFNLWPATDPLDPHYAIATAVQSVEGDSMINIRMWHETHYYSLLGRVSVLRIKGDVIKFLDAAEIKELERRTRNQNQGRPAGRTR